MSPVLAVMLIVSAPGAEQGALMSAMQAELARSILELRLPDAPKPYYLSYTVVDEQRLDVAASFGATVLAEEDRNRFLKVDLRVGDYSSDNTHFVGNSGFRHFFGASGATGLPLDDDIDALRRGIWLATDSAYKSAVEALEDKRAAQKSQKASADDAGSFSQESVSKVVIEDPPPLMEPGPYRLLVLKISSLFRDYGVIHDADVVLRAVRQRRHYLASDGSMSVQPRALVRLDVSADTQAADGMALETFRTFVVPLEAGLPQEAQLLAEVRKMAEELVALREAPVLDDYNGPVLFEELAAGQLLRYLLADNLSGTPPPGAPGSGGHRGSWKAMLGTDTAFSGKIGKRVLPKVFEVVDDPTIAQFGGKSLVGGYRVDDQGIPAQRLELVKGGRLQTFLMSRIPRKGHLQSNGRGRSGGSGSIRGMASNLLVSTTDGLSQSALRKKLLQAAEEAELEFGLIIRSLGEPGLAGSGDYGSRAMRSLTAGIRELPPPVAAYRLYPDGREELIRGAILSPMPVRSLKAFLAAGKTASVYNYFATGLPMPSRSFRGPQAAAPTSIVAPALLFEDLELTKSKGPHRKPPVLAHPYFESVAP